MKKNEIEHYNYRGVEIKRYNSFNQVSKWHKKNLKNTGVMVWGRYLPSLEDAITLVDAMWVDTTHAEILHKNRLIHDNVFVF
jgi:hypothetical protein